MILLMDILFSFTKKIILDIHNHLEISKTNIWISRKKLWISINQIMGIPKLINVDT